MSARICALGACPVTSVRGIDVPVPTTTFLKPPYDPGSPEDTTHLTAPPDQTFFHVVMRNATREILQVNFRTAAGRTWTLFANHWPSRSGGAHESAGHRHIAGETLAYFHQRALDVHGDDTPALAMGDFNDEPFDTSMVLHPPQYPPAAEGHQRAEPAAVEPDVARDGRTGRDLVLQQRAEHTALLDQFLVNSSMAEQNSPLKADPDSVEILRFDGMVDDGDYPSLYRSAAWATPSTRTASPTTSRSACTSPKPTEGTIPRGAGAGVARRWVRSLKEPSRTRIDGDDVMGVNLLTGIAFSHRTLPGSRS